MSTEDIRPEAPPVTALRAYMRSDGWTEGGHGSHGSVFTKGPAKIAVPHEDDDPDAVRMALYRLSAAEGRGADETTAAVLAYRQMSAPTKPCGCGPLEPCGEHLQALDDGECDRLRALMAGRGAETDAEGTVAGFEREDLGRLVREVWVACAREHPSPKPSWLVPWDELGEWDQEVDRRIGVSVAAHAAALTAVRMNGLHVKAMADAEATIAAVRVLCRSIPTPIAERILAVTGDGQEHDNKEEA